MTDAFRCNYGPFLGRSKQANYLRRMVKAGVCVDCRQPHDRGRWVCLSCRVKRQGERVRRATA